MRVLGVDPGKITGWAIVERGPEHNHQPRLVRVGVSSMKDVPGDLLEHIRSRPNLVVVEGWEVQGRRIDVNSAYPNQVIGMVRAYCHLYRATLVEAYSSDWKPQYARNGELLPSAIKTDRKHQAVANVIHQDLGLWPAGVLEHVENGKLRHVLDAIGLALWSFRVKI